eukprot:CAMPEP_0194195688 /NCGR_PEP_ID=MMETSP0154-20130528/76266_1 /TAXON_ID=1049557 /ORGANISM="Thalassiothrix antarctica, Strain L6-D1" /LENGTH=621 /DNA_ID=CAMNT_0038920233 /DNA_START=85 /DNA_END=1947 /DNA_ORIENTATION=+
MSVDEKINDNINEIKKELEINVAQKREELNSSFSAGNTLMTPTNLMDWEARQRTLKVEERRSKDESTRLLRTYKPTVVKQCNVKSMKDNDREKSRLAKQQLHSYRANFFGSPDVSDVKSSNKFGFLVTKSSAESTANNSNTNNNAVDLSGRIETGNSPPEVIAMAEKINKLSDRRGGQSSADAISSMTDIINDRASTGVMKNEKVVAAAVHNNSEIAIDSSSLEGIVMVEKIEHAIKQTERNIENLATNASSFPLNVSTKVDDIISTYTTITTENDDFGDFASASQSNKSLLATTTTPSEEGIVMIGNTSNKNEKMEDYVVAATSLSVDDQVRSTDTIEFENDEFGDFASASQNGVTTTTAPLPFKETVMVEKVENYSAALTSSLSTEIVTNPVHTEDEEFTEFTSVSPNSVAAAVTTSPRSQGIVMVKEDEDSSAVTSSLNVEKVNNPAHTDTIVTESEEFTDFTSASENIVVASTAPSPPEGIVMVEKFSNIEDKKAIEVNNPVHSNITVTENKEAASISKDDVTQVVPPLPSEGVGIVGKMNSLMSKDDKVEDSAAGTSSIVVEKNNDSTPNDTTIKTENEVLTSEESQISQKETIPSTSEEMVMVENPEEEPTIEES